MSADDGDEDWTTIEEGEPGSLAMDLVFMAFVIVGCGAWLIVLAFTIQGWTSLDVVGELKRWLG